MKAWWIDHIQKAATGNLSVSATNQEKLRQVREKLSALGLPDTTIPSAQALTA